MWWDRQQAIQATQILLLQKKRVKSHIFFSCGFSLSGVSYCEATCYVFSGNICKAYEKDVSGHEGILVKVPQNRLCPFFHSQLFSCWGGLCFSRMNTQRGGGLLLKDMKPPHEKLSMLCLGSWDPRGPLRALKLYRILCTSLFLG